MGATPTPGTGTGTSQMRPGTGTTTGQPPFIFEAAPGITTPPVSNGTPQPTGRSPLNPQSMTTPTPMNRNNHNTTPQTPMNQTPVTPNGVPQAPSNTTMPLSGMPQQMPGNMTWQMPGNMPQQMSGGTPVGVPSGMQSGQEMPYYYNPSMPYMTGNMPYVNYAPYQGIPNMYLPNTNAYNVPMGIPLFPLYGYDNSADLDHDVEYMKQLYPRTAKAIQKEIDNECDQMEYDGSMMFDEYPDKEYLDKLIDRVYDRIKQIDEEPQVEMNSLYFYPPRRNQNYLRDIVSLLLLSEIFNRRRRHRGRKRWF
jgi:hypothetical protein